MSSQERRPAEEVELVWEAPQQRKSGPGASTMTVYGDVLAKVKESPGRWARLRVFPSSGGAYTAKRNLTSALNGDAHWEVRVAVLEGEKTKTGRHGIYARYRTPEQLKAAKQK